jgi:hypothetical protein
MILGFRFHSRLHLVPAKGRTVRGERNFGLRLTVVLRGSESGWATDNVILEDIEGCPAMSPSAACELSSYTCTPAARLAEANYIKLPFAPPVESVLPAGHSGTQKLKKTRNVVQQRHESSGPSL